MQLCERMYAYILYNAIAETDDDDEQSSQSSLEGRDQLGKDQQA